MSGQPPHTAADLRDWGLMADNPKDAYNSTAPSMHGERYSDTTPPARMSVGETQSAQPYPAPAFVHAPPAARAATDVPRHHRTARNQISGAIKADDAFLLQRCYQQGMPLTVRLDRQRTYLHMAANKGSPKCIEVLVRLEPQLLTFLDDHNNPPLHLAVFHGQELAVKALLDNGADPSLPGGAGGTALHVALMHAKRDNATCMMHLLRAGVDVRRKSNDGRAAIHVAVVQEAQSTRDLVQTLLNYGAEVNHTKSNLDLFEVCCKMGNSSVAALVALHGGDMSCLLPPSRPPQRMSPAESSNHGRIRRVKAEFLEKVRAELHQLCDVRFGMCPLTMTPTKPGSFAQAGAAMSLACIESLHPDVQKAIASVHDSEHRGSERAVHDLRRCVGLFGYSERWVGTETHPGWFAVGTGTVRVLHPTERGFLLERTSGKATAALKLELSSTLPPEGIDILWAAVWTWLALHPPTNLHPQGVSIEDVVPNDLPMVWFPTADDSALFARLTAAIAEGTRRAAALKLSELKGDTLWVTPAMQPQLSCVMLPPLPVLSKLLILAAGDAPSAAVFAPLSDMSDALLQDHKAHVCGGTVLESLGRQDPADVTVATHLLACLAMEDSQPIPPAELDVAATPSHEALVQLTVARQPPPGEIAGDTPRWAERTSMRPRPVWHPQSLWRCPSGGVDKMADHFCGDKLATTQGGDRTAEESSSCGLVGVVPVGVIRNQYGNVSWSIKVTNVDAFRERPEMVQSVLDLVSRNHELYQGTSLQNLNEVFEANAAVEFSTHHHTVEKGRKVGWSVKGYVAVTVLKPEQREVHHYFNDRRIVESLKPDVIELVEAEKQKVDDKELCIPDLTPDMVDMSQPVTPKLRCSVFLDSCDSTPRQVGPAAMRMALGLFSEIVGADRRRTLASDATAQGADIEHDWMLVTVFGQDAYLVRLMEYIGRLVQVAADIAQDSGLPELAKFGKMGLRAVIADSALQSRPMGNDVTIGFMMPPLPALQQLLLITLSAGGSRCVPTPLPWQGTPTATEVEARATLYTADARAVLGDSVFDAMGKVQVDEQDPKQWFDHRVAQSAAVPFSSFEKDDLERLRRIIFEKNSDARRKDPALPTYKRHMDMGRLFVIAGLHCNFRDTETSQRGQASDTPSLMVVYVLALWSRLGFVRRTSVHSQKVENKARLPLPPMIPIESEFGIGARAATVPPPAARATAAPYSTALPGLSVTATPFVPGALSNESVMLSSEPLMLSNEAAPNDGAANTAVSAEAPAPETTIDAILARPTATAPAPALTTVTALPTPGRTVISAVSTTAYDDLPRIVRAVLEEARDELQMHTQWFTKFEAAVLVAQYPSVPEQELARMVSCELEAVAMEDTVEDLPTAIEKWGEVMGSGDGKAVRRAAKTVWSEQHDAVDALRGVVVGTHTVKAGDLAVVLQASPFIRFLLALDGDAVCEAPQVDACQSVLPILSDPHLTGGELRLQTQAFQRLRALERVRVPCGVVEDSKAPAVGVVAWTCPAFNTTLPNSLSAEDARDAVLVVLNCVRSAHAAGFRLTAVASLLPAWAEHTAQFAATAAGEATAHIAAFFRQQSALLAEGSAESTEVPAWLGWDGTGPVLAPPADVMFPATELRWSPPGPLVAAADDDEVASPPLLEFTTASCIDKLPTVGPLDEVLGGGGGFTSCLPAHDESPLAKHLRGTEAIVAAEVKQPDADETAAAFFVHCDITAAARCIESIAATAPPDLRSKWSELAAALRNRSLSLSDAVQGV